MLSRFCVSAARLTIWTRMVWLRMAARSLARATMRMRPSSSGLRLNGATDQPTSTWRVITWVMVALTSPVATGLALSPYSSMKRSTAMLVEEPAVEYAMVLSLASRIDRRLESATTYQNSSREPVELAPMMRTGAPFWNAPRMASGPALQPAATAPAMTAWK